MSQEATRGSPHTAPLEGIAGSGVNSRPSLKNPPGNHQLQAPTRKDVHRISCKKLTTPATQPVRNHYGPELLLFTNRLLFNITPANFLLHKMTFVSFVRPACGFWHSLLMPDCNSLPFPNKLLFAGKIHGLFSKVSRCDSQQL